MEKAERVISISSERMHAQLEGEEEEGMWEGKAGGGVLTATTTCRSVQAACACVRACVRACVSVCVRARACVFAYARVCAQVCMVMPVCVCLSVLVRSVVVASVHA